MRALQGLRIDQQDWSRMVLEAYPDFRLYQPRILSSASASADASASFTFSTSTSTTRTLVERSRGGADSPIPARTYVTMSTTAAAATATDSTFGAGAGVERTSTTTFEILPPDAAPTPTPTPTSTPIAAAAAATPRSRTWVLRVHLRRGQRVLAASIETGVDAVGVPTTTTTTTLGKHELPAMHISPVVAGEAASHTFRPFGGTGAAPAANAGDIFELELSPKLAQENENENGEVQAAGRRTVKLTIQE